MLMESCRDRKNNLHNWKKSTRTHSERSDSTFGQPPHTKCTFTHHTDKLHTLLSYSKSQFANKLFSNRFICQFQNLKNENNSLKQSLEELEKARVREQERSVGQVLRELPRGECEGKDMARDEADRDEKRKEDMIKVLREDGEGEEVLLRERKEEANNEMEIKQRGEAEGEKWIQTSRDKPENSAANSNTKMDIQAALQKEKQEEVARKMEADKLRQDIQNLSVQLRQAEEETDRQVKLVQELHYKLAEQVKKALEAEQKLIVLEAESQRLRKAAESLTEARKQIEV